MCVCVLFVCTYVQTTKMVNYDKRQTRSLVKVSSPKDSSRPIQYPEYAEYNLVISPRRVSALLWTKRPLSSRNVTFTLTK